MLVHGFDFWLDDHVLRQQVSNELQAIARKLGKPLIEVETNLREFTDQFLDWGLHCYGGGLASIALLLSGRLKKIYLPPTASYAHLDPWGSHPMLDPLWSTERLEIVHDGLRCHPCREGQMRGSIRLGARAPQGVLPEPAGKRPLRRATEKWNCGRCEKCVRTMLNLYIADALVRCPTFRTPLSPALIRQTSISDGPPHDHMEDNLLHLKEKEGDTELTRALSECVENYRRHRMIRMISDQGESSSPPHPGKHLPDQRRNTLFKSLWPVWGSWLTRESIKEEFKRLWGRRRRGRNDQQT